MFKVCHFDRSVILLCVRWYLDYGLSLRNLEEMMAERGISVDHATVHRWVIRYAPLLLERFNFCNRSVTARWHVDKAYVKVRGRWMYLYHAVDSVGDTVEFLFREQRDLPAAKRFFKQALDRHGRPDRVVIDGSQTNREVIILCDATNRIETGAPETTRPNSIRKSKYLSNRIEQDHRRVKRRVRVMLGFKSVASAHIILSGIKLVRMMRKRQARFSCNPNSSLAAQFSMLAA